MTDVLEDHKQEMSKFHLHKKSATNIEDVDKQFLKHYTTQVYQILHYTGKKV